MKAILKDTGEEVEVRKVVVSGGIYHDDECYYEDENGKRYDEQDLSVSAPIGWKQVRIKAAISALQGFAASPQIVSIDTLARWSVGAADSLIAELKKGGLNNDSTGID